MKNLLRRVGALAAVVMLCFALTVPALADETAVAGTAVTTYASLPKSGSGWITGDSSKRVDLTSPSSSFYWYPYNQSSTTEVSAVSWSKLNFSDDDAGFDFSSEGTYGIYFSFYIPETGKNGKIQVQNKTPSSSDFKLSYVPSSTGVRVYKPVTVSLYDWQGDGNASTDGVLLKASLTQSLADEILDTETNPVLLVNSASNSLSSEPAYYISFEPSSNVYPVNYRFYVNSFRVVSTASNATLSGLENIADKLTEQNQLMSAYYGDIVEICNQIYQRLGDMQATEEEAVALLSGVISALDMTNSKLSAINQAMSTYFELVIKTFQNESLSIQDCIDDAEARLEAYLKPMIDYFNELEEQTGESASTLPQHKTDIDGFSDQGYGIDGDGQAGLAALVPIFGVFSWIFSVIAIFVGVGIINLLVKKGLS